MGTPPTLPPAAPRGLRKPDPDYWGKVVVRIVPLFFVAFFLGYIAWSDWSWRRELYYTPTGGYGIFVAYSETCLGVLSLVFLGVLLFHVVRHRPAA